MPSPELLLVAFLVADASAVAYMLFRLHRQRAIDDITDLRYRNDPSRARRTLRR